MKQAIIDLGSNSIRLNVYEITGNRFKLLFRAKNMAGLAGYVELGKLTQDGMVAAEAALLEFREILQSLSIDNVAVFATASLRNVVNTAEAVRTLKQFTGFDIEVLTAEEEALLSFRGAMLDLPITDGAFADIGGASTELISFENGKPIHSTSCRIGSLSLYRRCVGKILPGHKSELRMSRVLDEELARLGDFPFDPRTPLVCVGGTARSALRFARKLFDLPPESRTVSADQVDEMLRLFLHNEKKTCRMLLRMEPDRIHTMIPGLFILKRVLHLFESDEMIVSKYGVREGFLCTKIMQSQTAITPSPRIGN